MKHCAVHRLAWSKQTVTAMQLQQNEGLAESGRDALARCLHVILSCQEPLLISSPSHAIGAKSIADS